jgi:hypothetical protein
MSETIISKGISAHSSNVFLLGDCEASMNEGMK